MRAAATPAPVGFGKKWPLVGVTCRPTAGSCWPLWCGGWPGVITCCC